MSFCKKQLSQKALVGAQDHLVCAAFAGEADQAKPSQAKRGVFWLVFQPAKQMSACAHGRAHAYEHSRQHAKRPCRSATGPWVWMTDC